MVSIRGCGETEICIHGWNINALFVLNRLPVSPKEVTYRERFPSVIPLLCRVKRIKNRNFVLDRCTHLLKVALLLISKSWRD